MASQLEHAPDVLDCLTQLPDDAVPTPPRIAVPMLDLLPSEIWTDPEIRILDPCSKSGVFLRESAKRLLVGLEQWEPDFAKRREHIFKKMLFGASTTELTGSVSRRTLYCSKDASGENAVVKFSSEAGNIAFVATEHHFHAQKCKLCGAPEALERGSSRENYAYSFIHGTYPTEELKDMKFDVIVGNPPYQIDSDGNTRTMPVYNKFVEQAIGLNPRYVLMITPSRWFAGGLGLDAYRERMLTDHRLSHFVDYPKSKDCFPGVKIRGGVSYFLWDREHTGGCEVKTVRGTKVGEAMTRDLDAYDVFVRHNEGVKILDKVLGAESEFLSDQVSSLVPFGLRAKFDDYVKSTSKGAVELHIRSRQTKWVKRSDISNNEQWIDSYKTLLHAAYGEDNDGPYSVIASPFVAGPNSACTETYLVVGAYGSKEEAEHLAGFLRTRFCRFLIWLRMNTQHLSKDRFSFVPRLPMTEAWTDEKLFKRYDLTKSEIDFVEKQIKEMGPGRSQSAG